MSLLGLRRWSDKLYNALGRIVVVVFCVCALATACRASAAAATEFCPARITGIDKKLPDRDVTVHYYRLQALADRVVGGTIIADTDAGWFTWIQPPAQLTRITYTYTSPELKYSYRVAESAELSVIFPVPVTIRHVWVAAARTHGDQFFGWDTHSTVSCQPPDFAPAKHPNATTDERTPQAGDETPAPAPSPANAVASAAPFPLASCAKPFMHATVTDPMQPDFPESLRDEGFSGVATSEIAVALNAQGTLVDAWIWAKSGYPQLDDAALRAARLSGYSGATSYCQPVNEIYLFRADFRP